MSGRTCGSTGWKGSRERGRAEEGRLLASWRTTRIRSELLTFDLWSPTSNAPCFCLAGRTPATSPEPFKGRAAPLMIPLLLGGGEAVGVSLARTEVLAAAQPRGDALGQVKERDDETGRGGGGKQKREETRIRGWGGSLNWSPRRQGDGATERARRRRRQEGGLNKG